MRLVRLVHPAADGEDSGASADDEDVELMARQA
jgi:hypothetical protein